MRKVIGVTILSIMLSACASTSETPRGWLNSDKSAVTDEAKFSLAMKKCDFIRAERSAIVETTGENYQAYAKARKCMENEGYLKKK